MAWRLCSVRDLSLQLRAVKAAMESGGIGIRKLPPQVGGTFRIPMPHGRFLRRSCNDKSRTDRVATPREPPGHFSGLACGGGLCRGRYCRPPRRYRLEPSTRGSWSTSCQVHQDGPRSGFADEHAPFVESAFWAKMAGYGDPQGQDHQGPENVGVRTLTMPTTNCTSCSSTNGR